MAQGFNRCRFCKKFEVYAGNVSLVKYGTRHYAHFDCYLDAGKKLADLSPWQASQFPYFLLKERGLLEEVKAICEKHNIGRPVA